MDTPPPPPPPPRQKPTSQKPSKKELLTLGTPMVTKDNESLSRGLSAQQQQHSVTRTMIHKKSRSGSVVIVNSPATPPKQQNGLSQKPHSENDANNGQGDNDDDENVKRRRPSVSKVAQKYENMMNKARTERSGSIIGKGVNGGISGGQEEKNAPLQEQSTTQPQSESNAQQKEAETNKSQTAVTRKRRNASTIVVPASSTAAKKSNTSNPKSREPATSSSPLAQPAAPKLVVSFNSSSDSDDDESPRNGSAETVTHTSTPFPTHQQSNSKKQRSVSLSISPSLTQSSTQRTQRSLTVRVETNRSKKVATRSATVEGRMHTKETMIKDDSSKKSPADPTKPQSDLSPSHSDITTSSTHSMSPSTRSNSSDQCLFASWCWKEGGLRKTWKRRYFKITDKYLTYGKSPYSVLSKIPLNIITTVTPYNHHAAPLRFRDFGWRMTVKKGKNAREFFIVAESKDEARVWMHVLKRVMKDSWDQYVDMMQTSGIVVEDEESRKNPRNSITVTPHLPNKVEAVTKGIESFRSRISLKDRFVNFTTHKQCFTGSDAVSVIQEVFRVNTRFQAVCIASRFLNEFGIIESAQSSVVQNNTRLDLHDEKNSLYRFTEKEIEISDALLESITNTPFRLGKKVSMEDPSTPLDPEKESKSQPGTRTKGASTAKSPVAPRTLPQEDSTIPSSAAVNAVSISTPIKQSESESSLHFNLPTVTRVRQQKKKIKSSVGAISKAVLLFSESVGKLEHLYSPDAIRIYAHEKREKKIAGRFKVAAAQREFIEEQISEAVRVENHKLQKVKREKKKNRMTSNTQDAHIKVQFYANREAKLHERIYRIEKLSDQFSDLNARFSNIESEYEGQKKEQQESKLIQLLREEHHEWENIEYEEDEEDNTSQQNTVLAKIKVKGRRKPQAYYEEKEQRRLQKQAAHHDESRKDTIMEAENTQIATQKTKQLDLKDAIMLTEAASFTVDTMKDIEMERLFRLQSLEADMDELAGCFRDLKHIIEDQKPNLDRIQTNVQNTNRNLEQGIENIRSARNNLGSSKLKEGITRTGNVVKWTTGWG
eukprot:CAMPEP_0117442284 /NCGR_PEP_ID=MMETSP0759-20121206/4071_1 /TAXON_ID=63605 /ORGANISM="Percolomonas cosmopolitus, Strain WS" /LENGTH=1053 /DNA_ID=CAMNT_0005234165 /DNA_START=189 /DNA_END=3350 /DNA_ORIENTATION=+